MASSPGYIVAACVPVKAGLDEDGIAGLSALLLQAAGFMQVGKR
jgi:hypothetical protein